MDFTLILAAGVASGTVLLFAAVGEIFAERSGILNLGVDRDDAHRRGRRVLDRRLHGQPVDRAWWSPCWPAACSASSTPSW